jgi:hypothetical protein
MTSMASRNVRAKVLEKCSNQLCLETKILKEYLFNNTHMLFSFHFKFMTADLIFECILDASLITCPSGFSNNHKVPLG